MDALISRHNRGISQTGHQIDAERAKQQQLMASRAPGRTAMMGAQLGAMGGPMGAGIGAGAGYLLGKVPDYQKDWGKMAKKAKGKDFFGKVGEFGKFLGDQLLDIPKDLATTAMDPSTGPAAMRTAMTARAFGGGGTAPKQGASSTYTAGGARRASGGIMADMSGTSIPMKSMPETPPAPELSMQPVFDTDLGPDQAPLPPPMPLGAGRDMSNATFDTDTGEVTFPDLLGSPVPPAPVSPYGHPMERMKGMVSGMDLEGNLQPFAQTYDATLNPNNGYWGPWR